MLCSVQVFITPAQCKRFAGLEASGVVVALGDGVSTLAVGDQVCALLRGYAEYVVTPAAHCLPFQTG